jgi:hypothetical protein
MNWSIAVGVLGILASVVVGWLTYRLADRRARNQRYAAAKSTVLQELSNPLGEDAVPTPHIIEATIRSVLREMGDPRVKLGVDDVLDDLLRQVTSDPFLDRDRRTKLQNDVLKVRDEWKGQGDKKLELSLSEYRERAVLRSTAFSGLLGILATLFTLSAMLILLRGAEADTTLRKAAEGFSGPRAILIPLLVGFGLLVTLFILFGDEFSGFMARVFRGRRH